MSAAASSSCRRIFMKDSSLSTQLCSIFIRVKPDNRGPLGPSTGQKNAAINQKPDLKCAILKARIKKNLNQTQLAYKIKVNPRLIQAYEKGEAIPDQEMISQLEKALGVKLH